MITVEKLKRPIFWLWVSAIAVLAALHFLHLRADFPNFSRWMDFSKYTDEGWYASAAIRAHLIGHWYVPGDFNPAPALPVLQVIEWVLFCFTGVSIEAARALSVSFFCVNLVLIYLLIRAEQSRWTALLAVTMAVTSAFLFNFTRLAILEPSLTCFTLTSLNLAVRMPRFKHQKTVAVTLGLLFVLMILTKTTAIFLIPALGWALWFPLRAQWRNFFKLAAIALGTAAFAWSSYFLLLVRPHYLADYKYLFFINVYVKPSTIGGWLMAYYYSFHGGLWCDKIMIPALGVALLLVFACWRTEWARQLFRIPSFGASLLAIVGYVFFVGYHNNMQPRYYAVIAVFSFILLAQISAKLVSAPAAPGVLLLAVLVSAMLHNLKGEIHTLRYPEYTLVKASDRLTRYILQHPYRNNLLVSISGNQLQLISHIPALCDDFGTEDLPTRLHHYNPGWYATWNSFDPGTLEDLHTQYSLEQVATYRAMDDNERNRLVLFRLVPLPNGQFRDSSTQNLKVQLPGDKFTIPINSVE